MASVPTKPLNSWMAFRSFYCPIFVGVPQKHRSSFLREMWNHDLFQAKWAIIAKSYSIIRDNMGKSNAYLSEFMALIAPVIGIIEAHDYLEVMGWALHKVDAEYQLTRIKDRDFGNFTDFVKSTTMSAQDVVLYCRDSGFIELDESIFDGITVSSGNLTMAAKPKHLATMTGSINAPQGIEAKFSSTGLANFSSNDPSYLTTTTNTTPADGVGDLSVGQEFHGFIWDGNHFNLPGANGGNSFNSGVAGPLPATSHEGSHHTELRAPSSLVRCQTVLGYSRPPANLPWLGWQVHMGGAANASHLHALSAVLHHGAAHHATVSPSQLQLQPANAPPGPGAANATALPPATSTAPSTISGTTSTTGAPSSTNSSNH